MHRGLLLLLFLHSAQKAEAPTLHWEHGGSGPAAEEWTSCLKPLVALETQTCGCAEGSLLLSVQSLETSYVNALALPKHAKKVPDQRSKEIKTVGLENINSLAQVSSINLKKKKKKTNPNKQQTSITWEKTNNAARNKFLFQSNVNPPFFPKSMKFQSNHAVHVQSSL